MTDELERVPDHARRAILSLNPVFWGKPRIASFVWALATEVQELEDATFTVIERRTVDAAGDAQLEVLGRLVRQPNTGGFETELYRALIKARIRTNRSHGSLRDILETLRLIHPTGAGWFIAGWATLGLVIDDAGELVIDAVEIVLRNAKQAEEGILLYVARELGGLRADSAASTAAATGGWGSVSNPSAGGRAYHVRRVSHLT